MVVDIGLKKVVYKDGNYTKVLRGRCFFEDDFIKIETGKGIVWIGKGAIISIKDGGAR